MRVLGTGLGEVTAVLLAGDDLDMRIVTRAPDRIDVVVSVATNAAPGPRTFVLTSMLNGERQGDQLGGLFHVLPLSSYGGMAGIGSHLI